MGKKIKKKAELPPKDVFDPLTTESKNVAIVVLMLNSPEEEILAKAEAIYKFSLKDDVKMLRELDVMNSVIAQLAPEEEVVIHDFASLGLANMSAEYTSKVQILEHGGLKPLIRLLSSPDPDVKKNSIECVYNLVQDFQCAMLQELNAIPSILALLKSEYPVIQLLALKTLDVITSYKGSQAMLRDNQGMDHYIKILESKELNDLHTESLSVIANCLVDVDTMVLILDRVLKELLAFAENSTVPDIQKNAAKAITKAAYDRIKLFHEQEVENSALQGSESDGTEIAALHAVSAMHENSGSRLLKSLGVPQLVQLLDSDHEEVKEAAALALANLTTCNPANANAAAEADSIGPLINLLSSKRDGAIANAATMLTNMATQVALRETIQNHDITHALIGPLWSANTVVQSKDALTIRATACDVEAWTELRNSGALEPLIELLRSRNGEVRTASWAVMVCASDELTATELCSLLLLELQLSVLMPTFRFGAMLSSACRIVDENEQVKLTNSSGERQRKGRGGEEEEVTAAPKWAGEGGPCKEWYPPSDPYFCAYVYEVIKSLLPVTNTKEQVFAKYLAKYVPEKMGSKIPEEKLQDFSWQLHISEIKFQLKSNVVPIGQIKEGTFYHRALLFKALADKSDIGYSLVLEVQRAWNEIRLMNESQKRVIGGLPPTPEVYIVDLMFHPGGLMKLKCKEADLYKFLKNYQIKQKG
ncbi:LOW QUALITY PROTEIN: armadillo repeat-containing protein 3 [Glossophaga mutica]